MSFKKNIHLIAVLVLIVGISSCRNEFTTDPPTQEPDLTELRGAYLGQTPPGNVPIKFAPNNLFIATSTNWWYHGSPVFSPDGNEMYFVKYIHNPHAVQIWFTKSINGQWTVPQKTSFSTSSFDNNPYFGASNDTLYFQSQRGGGIIFRVTRTTNGWTQPTALNIPYPSGYGVSNEFYIARNKSIYFSLELLATGSDRDIYRSRFINGSYTQPENLGLPINTSAGEGVGYVDPDERFIIYYSPKPGGLGFHDLYISSRNQNGTWNNPISLGPLINSSTEEIDPYITPDGRYFFFNTSRAGDDGYTPYWVDATFLDALR